MPLIISMLAGLSVGLFILGVFRPNAHASVRRRVTGMQAPGRPQEALSFNRRVLVPAAVQITVLVTRLLPTQLFRSTAARMETAGLQMQPGRFVTGWVLLALFLPLLGLLASVALHGSIAADRAFALLAWLVVGLLLPRYWLRNRARTRTRAIDRSLADAIDLIVTNVESGLGLQAAMINVAQKLAGPIAEEFDRVAREGAIGRPREEALDAMARRTASRDMQLFVRAIIQAERTGIPIAGVLRGQARELRDRHRQLAREQANRMPIKITLPTVMFMFPTLFMLVLAPVVLNALETMGLR